MSATQVLLTKISALRQRLEQADSLAHEARTAATTLMQGQGAPLDQQTAAGGEQDARLDRSLRLIHESRSGTLEQGRSPRQLSARARRVLERGKELLLQIRSLADEFTLPTSAGVTSPFVYTEPEPLALLYRETVAMVDTALRTVSLLPDSTATQLHLCQGLEATLDVVAERIRTLLAATTRQRQEEDRITGLIALLNGVADGQVSDIKPFRALAGQLLAEVRSCAPLRFLSGNPEDPAHFIACHSLTVARVIARVIRHDPDLRGQSEEGVVAALLHDIGMLRLPSGLLNKPDSLDDEQRREIEAHCRLGVELIAPLAQNAPWLAEAVSSHHERLDGTGYPDGVRQTALNPLTRLLSVCDVYAALCCTRPQRGARTPRTALADTLLLAEAGHLDRRFAECLLHLSFYPVGSLVELAHGAMGVVVAAPASSYSRREMSSPARPVVALLTDESGEAVPLPQHLDLAQSEDFSIIRSLGANEQRQVLGRFPQWSAA